jgi:hypothetical protein
MLHLFPWPPSEPDVKLSPHPALWFPSLLDIGLLSWTSLWHLRQSAMLFRCRAIIICLHNGLSLRPFLFRFANFRMW